MNTHSILLRMLSSIMFLSCCPLVKADGRLRGGRQLQSNNLFIAQSSAVYPSDSPWPHFRGLTNQNNGRSNDYGPIQQPSSVWEFFENSTDVYSTPAIESDGTIYIPLNASVYAISIDGLFKWSYDTNAIIYSSPAIAISGDIYFGSDQFYCLSSSGALQWTVATTLRVLSAPAIADDGMVYFLDSYGYLFAVSSAGSISWKYTLQGYVYHVSPAVASDGSIYVGDDNKYLYSISSLGTLNWNYLISDTIECTPTIGDDDTVYVGTTDGEMYAFASNGTFIWEVAIGAVYIGSPGLSQDGYILYIGCNNNIFYALDAYTGATKWTYTTGDSIASSPVIGVDDTVYFGSSDSFVYALSMQGTLLWKFETAGSVISSPVIGYDGRMYIASNDGTFYALGGISAAPTAAPVSSNSSSSALSAGAIAGIVIGCVAFLCFLIGALFYFLVVKKNASEGDEKESYNNVIVEEDGLSKAPFPASAPAYPPSSTTDSNSQQSRSLRISPLKGSMSRGSNFGFFSNALGEIVPTKSLNSAKSAPASDVFVPGISWYDIELKASTMKEAVIGQGSFGSVVLAKLNAKQPDGVTLVTEKDIVIKVYTKSLAGARDEQATEKILKVAVQEVSLLMNAESKILYKDCIVKVFGIAAGSLPPHICHIMNVAEDAEAVGIVMRCEEGGTLHSFIHPSKVNGEESISVLAMKDKLRLLAGIARGIAELHTAGIIHGDIKPDNILLSSKNILEAEIRLADFGLAAVREDNSALQSSLGQTAHTRGTPLYCAPEMLVNPYEENFNDKVAKASRKTDVYAFSILAWEVLTEKRPFPEFKSEMVLSGKVHQGKRPPIEAIPTTCPPKIVTMITNCWDSDRSKRRSAVECFSTLKHYHGLMINAVYDVYLICHSNRRGYSDCIYNRLTQRGLNVLFITQNVNNAGSSTSLLNAANEETSQPASMVGMNAVYVGDVETNNNSNNNNNNNITSTDGTDKNHVITGISSSQVVLVCIDQAFQDNESCLFEIKEARKVKPPRPIIPLFLEANYIKWLNDEVKYHCRMGDTSVNSFDVSQSANDESWLSDDGPNGETVAAFNTEMDVLSEYLKNQLIVTTIGSSSKKY